MKFGHFAHVWGKPGMTPHDRYELLWREVQQADRLGFDYAGCVEHHFRPDESWMSAPSLFAVGAGARTKNIRLGAMGYIVPLHDPVRLAEEIAIVDQMIGGRFEVGLVTGIVPEYFGPFDVDFDERKPITLEYLEFLKAAFGEQPFSFSFAGERADVTDTKLAVLPAQKPCPPIWMQSRDPETLEVCAREGLHTGYFFVFPRADAAPRYRKFLEDWAVAGWDYKPNIAYTTLVYVDETDERARDVALSRAGRAYEGFLPPPQEGETFDQRVETYSKRFINRGEDGAAKIMLNLFNAEHLLENDLIFIGSPETVTRQLKQAASDGVFNTFMGEFNFSDLPEDDLMRSMKLFGEEVMPALRDFEPY